MQVDILQGDKAVRPGPIYLAPLAALPEAFAPWDSCEPYPTPSCGACPAPAAGALRRASPCAVALRRVRPPAGAAGGGQGARSRAGGAKVLLKFLSTLPLVTSDNVDLITFHLVG